MTNDYYAGNYVKRCDHIAGGSIRVPIAMWSLGVFMTELREAGSSFKV